MVKFNIGSDSLRVTVKLTGAELSSIIDLTDGCEHLWQGDPAYWPRQAPLLFPTVGESKDGHITVGDRQYPMGRHGFTRFKEFELAGQTDSSVTLVLRADEETRLHYPFEFELETTYTVEGRTILQQFVVRNTGPGAMAFQLGGHPAFAVPCGAEGEYDEHSIVLGSAGNLDRHLLTKEGLYSGEVRPFVRCTDRFAISHGLFAEDAIVFKDAGITEASLLNHRTGKAVRMRFEGFPHLGVWSVPGAGYVCIEPWIGCADDADGTNDLFKKDSAIVLAAGGEFRTGFSIEVLERL